MFQKMNSTMRLCSISLIAAAAITMIGGCADDPATSNNVTMVKPGAGSTFTFSKYELDDSHAKVPGSESTETKTVTNASMTLQGESNVYMIAGSEDTTYFSYQSNGDIKIFMANIDDSVAATWLTLPVGSKTAQSSTLFSGSIDILGTPFPMSVKWSAQHIGTGNVSVGSETLATQMIEQKIETTLASAVTISRDTLWIAPSIGFIAKENQFEASALGQGSGESMTLTSYTMK
jgi:hypothetical protein